MSRNQQSRRSRHQNRHNRSYCGSFLSTHSDVQTSQRRCQPQGPMNREVHHSVAKEEEEVTYLMHFLMLTHVGEVSEVI